MQGWSISRGSVFLRVALPAVFAAVIVGTQLAGRFVCVESAELRRLSLVSSYSVPWQGTMNRAPTDWPGSAPIDWPGSQILSQTAVEDTER